MKKPTEETVGWILKIELADGGETATTEIEMTGAAANEHKAENRHGVGDGLGNRCDSGINGKVIKTCAAPSARHS